MLTLDLLKTTASTKHYIFRVAFAFGLFSFSLWLLLLLFKQLLLLRLLKLLKILCNFCRVLGFEPESLPLNMIEPNKF